MTLVIISLVVHEPLSQSHFHPSHCLAPSLMTLQTCSFFTIAPLSLNPLEPSASSYTSLIPLSLEIPHTHWRMQSNPTPASGHEICKVTLKLPVSVPRYVWSQWSIRLLSVFLDEPDELLAVLICPVLYLRNR